MPRRLLLAAGSTGNGGGGGEVPGGDPSLVTPRAVTREVLAINQPTRPLYVENGANPAGTTGRTPLFTMQEDASEISLVFSGCSSVWQAPISNPMTVKVTIEPEFGGTITPVTFNGEAVGLIPRNASVESDPVTGNFYEGMRFRLRVFTPIGQVVNLSQNVDAFAHAGDHVSTQPWASDYPYPGPVAMPIAILGKTRASVITVGAIGDSILNTPPQFDRPSALWFSEPIEDAGLTGINFGQEARQYSNRDALDGCMHAVTHMLVEYGVNNIPEAGITVPTLWAVALDCYDAIDAEKPGIPIWQTTPTPIVITGNSCATLDGQFFTGSASTARRDSRLAWIAWQRDGCPIDPSTRGALAVGATGSAIRVGHADHPLRGIVDIAAAVEDGGSSSPSGKWRVDLGPLGGDGVHPSPLGEQTMKTPVAAWLATIA